MRGRSPDCAWQDVGVDLGRVDGGEEAGGATAASMGRLEMDCLQR